MTDLNTAHLRRPVFKRRLRLGIVGGGRGGLVGEWHAAGARLFNQRENVAGALSSDSESAARSAQNWIIHYSPFGEPDQSISRGRGACMLPTAERLSHLPRGPAVKLLQMPGRTSIRKWRYPLSHADMDMHCPRAW